MRNARLGRYRHRDLLVKAIFFWLVLSDRNPEIPRGAPSARYGISHQLQLALASWIVTVFVPLVCEP
jgi:hypothetical protein